MYFSCSHVTKIFTVLTIMTQVLLVPDQKVSANPSDFHSDHSETRLAYYRWRTWLLGHSAIRQQIPPAPRTAEDSAKNEADMHEEDNQVQVKFTPINIFNVDEAQQTVQLSAKLDLWWIDEDLVVNASLAESFTDGDVSFMPAFVSIPSGSLWMPHLIVSEGVVGMYVMEDIDHVHVDQSGNISVSIGTFLSLVCNFDMATYPFDEHDCTVSFIDTSETLNVAPSSSPWDKTLSESFAVSGEWKLTNTTPHKMTLPTSGKVFARFVINLQRKTTFYVVVILLPMVLTSYLNVLVFLIPPDVGDKASYLVTITISLSVFTSFFNANMPRGIDSALPQVFQLICFLCVEGFFILVLTLIVLRKYKAEQSQPEAGATTEVVFCSKGRVSPHPDEGEAKGRACPHPDDGQQKWQRSLNFGKWSSRQLDIFFFAISFAVNTIVIAALLIAMMKAKG